MNELIKDVKLLIRKFDKQLLYSCLNKFLHSKPACLFRYWRNFDISEFM